MCERTGAWSECRYTVGLSAVAQQMVALVKTTTQHATAAKPKDIRPWVMIMRIWITYHQWPTTNDRSNVLSRNSKYDSKLTMDHLVPRPNLIFRVDQHTEYLATVWAFIWNYQVPRDLVRIGGEIHNSTGKKM